MPYNKGNIEGDVFLFAWLRKMLNIHLVIWSTVTMSILKKISNLETILRTLNILQFETSVGHVHYEHLQKIGEIESQTIGELGATEYKNKACEAIVNTCVFSLHFHRSTNKKHVNC